MNKLLKFLLLSCLIVPRTTFASKINQNENVGNLARIVCVPYNMIVFEDFDIVKATKALLPTTDLNNTEADYRYVIYRCSNQLNGETCYIQFKDNGLQVINCFKGI